MDSAIRNQVPEVEESVAGPVEGIVVGVEYSVAVALEHSRRIKKLALSGESVLLSRSDLIEVGGLCHCQYITSW